MKLLITKFSPVSCYLLSLGSSYSPECPFLEHPLCAALNVRKQVSNPYKTKDKITVLYALIFVCDSKRFSTEW